MQLPDLWDGTPQWLWVAPTKYELERDESPFLQLMELLPFKSWWQEKVLWLEDEFMPRVSS